MAIKLWLVYVQPHHWLGSLDDSCYQLDLKLSTGINQIKMISFSVPQLTVLHQISLLRQLRPAQPHNDNFIMQNYWRHQKRKMKASSFSVRMHCSEPSQFFTFSLMNAAQTLWKKNWSCHIWIHFTLPLLSHAIFFWDVSTLSSPAWVLLSARYPLPLGQSQSSDNRKHLTMWTWGIPLCFITTDWIHNGPWKEYN